MAALSEDLRKENVKSKRKKLTLMTFVSDNPGDNFTELSLMQDETSTEKNTVKILFSITTLFILKLIVDTLSLHNC